VANNHFVHDIIKAIILQFQSQSICIIQEFALIKLVAANLSQITVSDDIRPLSSQ